MIENALRIGYFWYFFWRYIDVPRVQLHQRARANKNCSAIGRSSYLLVTEQIEGKLNVKQ
jgi:hypothetical protein